jgi:hypothetical protein
MAVLLYFSINIICLISLCELNMQVKQKLSLHLTNSCVSSRSSRKRKRRVEQQLQQKPRGTNTTSLATYNCTTLFVVGKRRFLYSYKSLYFPKFPYLWWILHEYHEYYIVSNLLYKILARGIAVESSALLIPTLRLKFQETSMDFFHSIYIQEGVETGPRPFLLQFVTDSSR